MTTLTRLAAVALAVFALTATAGTAAAAPGNAPADSDRGADGPPAELPGPVPDFVSGIHDLIGQFVDGTLDTLGSPVSDAAGNGGNAGGAP